MRSTHYFVAAALVLGLSGTAMAQTSRPPSAPAPTPAIAPANDAGLTRSHFITSGFVGSNFGSVVSDVSISNRRSFGFGGQFGYLWRGIVGGEFLADFTPSFGVSSAALPDNPRVNSYMGNAVGALPLGPRGQYQPYASGGFGGIQMRFTNLPSSASSSSNSQLTGGGNIGGGIMMFAGKVGVRGDIRYFRAMKNDTPSGTVADEVTQTLLSDLGYWRTNVGIAFQW